VSHRYLAEGASVAEIADTLGCAQITLIAEMDRLGIPRRPQDQRLALGRALLAAQRANKAGAHEARVRELGFDGLAAYFRARHHDQGWPYPLIAQELGLTVAVVRRLMRQADVPGFRGVRRLAGSSREISSVELVEPVNQLARLGPSDGDEDVEHVHECPSELVVLEDLTVAGQVALHDPHYRVHS
jgi:hypothetical protein